MSNIIQPCIVDSLLKCMVLCTNCFLLDYALFSKIILISQAFFIYYLSVAYIFLFFSCEIS